MFITYTCLILPSIFYIQANLLVHLFFRISVKKIIKNLHCHTYCIALLKKSYPQNNTEKFHQSINAIMHGLHLARTVGQ